MPSTGFAAAATAALPDWLPRQRWFAGRGRPVDEVSIVLSNELRADDPELAHVVVSVSQQDGSDRYSLFLGATGDVPERLEHAVVGTLDGSSVYDAPHDQTLTAILLQLLAVGGDSDGLHFEPIAPELTSELPSIVIGAEQSNTSVVFGEEYILKLFRRIAPGVNPDLEITRALAAAGCERIVPPLAFAQTSLDGEATTVGLLQPFLRSATDGWALATTSVRDLYAEGDLHASEVGGDFAAESERLGAATAEVHRTMAEVLPTEVMSGQRLAQLVRAMNQRLDEALGVAPQLAPYEAHLREAFAAAGRDAIGAHLQRIHGDFHLGQSMRTESGWVLFDFEGEPARPLAERRALMSPLRDVAGMLRSFEYAARYLLADHPSAPQLAYRATEWADRNREAFCDGYSGAGGTDPRSQTALLRAFELEKAVYEVVYETRHRPTWLPIPLGSIERLVA